MLVLNDYFEPEQYIIEQLQTLKPDHFKHVQSALNVEQVLEYGGKAPAAFLIFSQHQIVNSKRHVMQEQQIWMVAVLARNRADTEYNTHVRRDAGPLLYHVDKALHGFAFANEAGQASALKATTPPEAFEYLPGTGVFTRAFSLEFVNSSSNR